MKDEELQGWRRMTDESDSYLNLEETIKSDIERLTAKGIKLTFYVGCDSHIRKKIITYAKVIAVKMDIEESGVGVFCYYKRDKIPKEKNLMHRDRLWTEVYKSVEVAQWLDQLLEPLGHCVSEVHADLNPNPEYLSNCVASMCLGYIKSMGFLPVLKPNSWCADAADDKSK